MVSPVSLGECDDYPWVWPVAGLGGADLLLESSAMASIFF